MISKDILSKLSVVSVGAFLAVAVIARLQSATPVSANTLFAAASVWPSASVLPQASLSPSVFPIASVFPQPSFQPTAFPAASIVPMPSTSPAPAQLQPVDPVPATPWPSMMPLNRSYFLVNPIVTENYHYQDLNLENCVDAQVTQWYSFWHKAIDVTASGPCMVKSAGIGKVTFAGWAAGYGNLVVIDHGNGLQTYYAHGSEPLVKAGQDVYGYSDLFEMSDTSATGRHLHFEIRINGELVDPTHYIYFPGIQPNSEDAKG